MPRFHFNAFDGSGAIECGQMDLPDLVAARQEAICLAGMLLSERHSQLTPGGLWMMEVTDSDDLLLIRLDFAISEYPVIGAGPSQEHTRFFPSTGLDGD